MLESVTDRNLHNLVDQHKLGLSVDDAITLESFQTPIPKMFVGVTSLTSLKLSSCTWIATMASSASWEDIVSQWA